jgi:hypothetical protein
MEYQPSFKIYLQEEPLFMLASVASHVIGWVLSRADLRLLTSYPHHIRPQLLSACPLSTNTKTKTQLYLQKAPSSMIDS